MLKNSMFLLTACMLIGCKNDQQVALERFAEARKNSLLCAYKYADPKDGLKGLSVQKEKCSTLNEINVSAEAKAKMLGASKAKIEATVDYAVSQAKLIDPVGAERHKRQFDKILKRFEDAGIDVDAPIEDL